MDTDGRGFPPGDLRVSDDDRDRALAELSEAFQAGRITSDEFDQRSEQALGSRTGKELTALLADLPVRPRPVGTTVVQRAERLPSARITVAASVAATCFAYIAVASAIQPSPSLQQQELIRQFFARQGIQVTLPAAQGFNWSGTITPAVIAVLLVVLVIVLRTVRARHQ